MSVFLLPLIGRVIAIEIEPFDEKIYLCPTKKSIQIIENHIGNVDTTMRGTLPAFGVLGLSSTPMRSIFSGDITIEGDTEVAHQFQQLFKQLDVDFEEVLSRLTGDIVAHNVGNLFRSGQQWTGESIQTFKLNSKEFLQEETRDLPASPEAELLYQQVDDVRSNVDRLVARLDQIQINRL